ncbi:hypothetical protein FNF29_01360 [Cafeteria roenbergensis]|uniref:RAP domain-containing protein n=1 Tax=Cafeteria roenbergensis TaxID=33653 RepID=A0A5A8CVR5_CAFRO|nr:hypothetical protein FNF29_01360 [Cafeteria roenbergensis]|eukprot:KAA0155941.1 hypothetical protein FNF29_01360 [Cafeteria roenbergensis]
MLAEALLSPRGGARAAALHDPDGPTCSALRAFARSSCVAPVRTLDALGELLSRDGGAALASAHVLTLGRIVAYASMASGDRPERRRLLLTACNEIAARAASSPTPLAPEEASALAEAARAALRTVAFASLPGTVGAAAGSMLAAPGVEPAPRGRTALAHGLPADPGSVGALLGAALPSLLAPGDAAYASASYTLLATLAHVSDSSGRADAFAGTVLDVVGVAQLQALRADAARLVASRRQALAGGHASGTAARSPGSAASGGSPNAQRGAPPQHNNSAGTVGEGEGEGEGEGGGGGLAVSGLHASISAVLSRTAGLPPHALEHAVSDPPALIDVAFPGAGVAMEVDGPWHYEPAAAPSAADMAQAGYAQALRAAEPAGNKGRGGGRSAAAQQASAAVAGLPRPAKGSPDAGRAHVPMVRRGAGGYWTADWRLVTARHNEPTRARHMLLRRGGWSVVPVDYGEWQRRMQPGGRQAEEGCQSLLRAALASGGLGGEGSEAPSSTLWEGTPLGRR